MNAPQKSPDGRDIDADGWIAWRGGSCPVAAETVVEVKCRGAGSTASSYACRWYWKHYDKGRDIIAYRIVKPAPPSPAAVEHVERGEEAKTLRDEFAMAALTGLLANSEGVHAGMEPIVFAIKGQWAAKTAEALATHSYDLADAMMALRSRTVTRTGER